MDNNNLGININNQPVNDLQYINYTNGLPNNEIYNQNNLNQNINLNNTNNSNSNNKKNKNTKKFLIIGIGALLAIGGVFYGLVVNSKSGENKDQNNINNNSNNNENTNNGFIINNYTYFKDLDDREKNEIIDKATGSCKLKDEITINKNIKDWIKSYGDTTDLFLNRVLKFECADNNETHILLDAYYYGIVSVSLSASGGPTIADGTGKYLTETNIYYGDELIYGTLPYEYYTYFNNTEMGDYNGSEIVPTKVRFYLTHKVDEFEDINLDDLYIYYISYNKAENIYSLNNSDTKCARIKLDKGTDSMPDVPSTIAKNEEDLKEKKLVLDSCRTDYVVTIIDYKIEKYNNKNFLIVNYTRNNEDGTPYKNFVKYNSEIKLVTKDELYYLPLEINKEEVKTNGQLFTYEAVYILPDNYNLDNYYLSTKETSSIGYSEKVLKLTNVPKK